MMLTSIPEARVGPEMNSEGLIHSGIFILDFLVPRDVKELFSQAHIAFPSPFFQASPTNMAWEAKHGAQQ